MDNAHYATHSVAQVRDGMADEDRELINGIARFL